MAVCVSLQADGTLNRADKANIALGKFAKLKPKSAQRQAA
ncbi:hypothetical protein XOO4812 [Xanthomonas oryzae pv. oryzae KACC 10331]|uniref:Uncharacterized protein n=2 Tax=Xanthomonas oryzae pv. oryzae TaxID=64187 RepID=Q05HY7_XANOR|nr:hypothetical protein XOO4812 [Xanthomonas oryzae pv. oryzae KACC 10331]ACD58932.1 hypothetical protein PXO_00562 [Xanthomonas oryzae pv. oryzae PXO99A]